MKNILIYTFSLLLSVPLLYACNDSEDDVEDEPKTVGMAYAKTDKDAFTVYNTIVASLNANENISIIAEVNHASNANNTGLELDFTRTVYFGNPALGTPIMIEHITAGLDLPQRISVYVNADGDTIIAYNAVAYLTNRHNVGSASTVGTVSNALSNIVTSATDETISINSGNTQQNEGIISVTSANDFATTYNNIINALNGNTNISIMAELDHQANAESAGLELQPAKLIIFGNPTLGTPLMQESRSIALDLPQKILVYQDSSGGVHIAYNDPNYLAERHNITYKNDTIETISQALQSVANAGASEN